MPSFELKHTDELKNWLIKELEPICDADPEVLSDYVLALLKHDGSDETLQASLQEQLEDFLAEQTKPFVEKAFIALRSQSYLPEAKRTVQASGSNSQDIPSTSTGSSRKRSADDEGSRSPAKTFRDGETNQGQKRERRAPNDNNHRSEGSRQNKPRQMCRDFHQRGFCARGESCKFDHSLPQQPPGENNGFNLNPMMGMQIPHQHMNQPYGLPSQQSGPNNGFMGMGPQFALGGPPIGWNSPQGMVPPPHQEIYQGPPPVDGAQNGFLQGEGNGNDLSSRMDSNAPQRGDFGQRGRGSSRGGRGGGLHGGRGAFEKKQTSNTTLVIENVPVENLELVKVNEYFKKFGTITNIQIDIDSKKALVSYSQPSEAKAAHSSPEVIFNNRFVKVYFQRLDEPLTKPSDNVPTPPKPAPGPPVKSNFVPGQNKFVRPNLVSDKAKEAQDIAQKKLDDLMSEQKEIMTKLTGGSASADEKKTLMARFGTLEGEIKQATEEVRTAVRGASSLSNGISNTPSATQLKEQRDLKQREQLDRELEALKNGAGEGSTTEELKETLARLQAEAAQLGIESTEAGVLGTDGSYRGGFRGRARGAPFRGGGRGFGYPSYRGGRGGLAVNRASMSLDNRPSKLRVTDIPEPSNEEHRSKVKAYMQQFGETHSIEDKDDGSLVVHYKVRANGEQALRSGLSVPEIGTIKATWAKEAQSVQPAANEGEHESNTFDAEGDEDEGDREESFRR